MIDVLAGGAVGATLAFGYHTQHAVAPVHEPSISQRTVNDSAAIAVGRKTIAARFLDVLE